MSFLDIDSKIETSYYSAKCNLVDAFYNIALSESTRYDRVSGFFSSTSLAVAALGMTQFILNKGHMRLVCSAKLNPDDVEAINDSDDLKRIISYNFAEDFESIENELLKNHVKMLGWMISKGILEIKIGVKVDENGNLDSGMVHPKIGILYDELNNSIVFDGSVNESKFGWLKNVESLRVFKSWKHMEFMEKDADHFDDLWYNSTENVEVFDIPDIPKSILIDNAPKSDEEFEKLIFETNEELKKSLSKSKPKLRDYQNEAVKNWINNSYKGIFSMATGTGKTYTALSCFDRLIGNKESILTVIACPQVHLINQWEKSLKSDFKYNGKCIITSEDKKWKKNLMSVIGDLMGSTKNAVVLTSFDKFSDDDFIDIINLHLGESFLIVDEVHGIGALKYRQGFLNVSYEYILGLSATPEIEDDLERTELVYDNFGGVVYEYGLEEAIDNGFLTKYTYHPIFVDLTDEELKKYKKYSRIIASLIGNSTLSLSDEEKLNSNIRKRRNLINKAENKLIKFNDFLNKHKDIKDLIVYGADKKHLNKIKTVLNEHHINNHKFTGDEKTKTVNGILGRDDILKLFSEGHFRALRAIKCLDEGVDVPSTQNAVLLASTLNSRQHIQRRGRILRNYPGKKCAHIYDFIVIPNLKGESDSVKNIFRSETKRYEEYARLADNDVKCMMKLTKKWEELI
ncbi:DEAD/DEAH box helicase family protein [Methanobrevibacter sp.]|uniref:DEAD/DEAH box helicase family protein n=1 Tax=Methanobrevibacter sp. TaxID=66852 RepID=UPI00386CF25F